MKSTDIWIVVGEKINREYVVEGKQTSRESKGQTIKRNAEAYCQRESDK